MGFSLIKQLLEAMDNRKFKCEKNKFTKHVSGKALEVF